MTVRASENAKRAELQQLTQQAAEQIDRLLQPVGVAAQGLAGRLPHQGEDRAHGQWEVGLKAMVDGNKVFFCGTVAYRPHGHDAQEAPSVNWGHENRGHPVAGPSQASKGSYGGLRRRFSISSHSVCSCRTTRPFLRIMAAMNHARHPSGSSERR